MGKEWVKAFTAVFLLLGLVGFILHQSKMYRRMGERIVLCNTIVTDIIAFDEGAVGTEIKIKTRPNMSYYDDTSVNDGSGILSTNTAVSAASV